VKNIKHKALNNLVAALKAQESQPKRPSYLAKRNRDPAQKTFYKGNNCYFFIPATSKLQPIFPLVHLPE
jgi:hypothetical protein